MKDYLKYRHKLIIVLILVLAAFFRLYGLNWDQNQHLHPDERFLTMVVTAIKTSQSFLVYLNPKISPMNPVNVGYDFFVYGTFPLYLTKVVGELLGYHDYTNIHFVGRFFSAFFDLGVVFLVFKIGRKVYDEKVGLWAAFLYSIMVLPIQLSHFFTVDTFLNFFIVLSFYLLVLLTTHYSLLATTFLGISFGLALACKVSALYFLPIIGLGYFYLLGHSWKKKRIFRKVFFSGLLFLVASYLTLRLNQPSIFASSNFLDFHPNPQLLANFEQLKSFNQPDTWFPPSIQWKKTKAIIFPLKNLVFWGLGLPLGIIAIVATAVGVTSKQKTLAQFLILFWVLALFLYQGTQFCKTMRYFLPIYPFLALLSAQFLKRVKRPLVGYLLLVVLLVYPFSFLSIYTRPITRVTASEWIYQHLAAGSTLANEHWDDPLPLYLPGENPGQYKIEMLSLYDPETPGKWEKINSQLERTDYIILSSNRLYGSIPQHPDYYPKTSLYYQSLFDGSLGFEKVAEFTSYPCFPPIKPYLFCLPDDWAEEAFTVYDHPKVIIFKKSGFNKG